MSDKTTTESTIILDDKKETVIDDKGKTYSVKGEMPYVILIEENGDKRTWDVRMEASLNATFVSYSLVAESLRNVIIQAQERFQEENVKIAKLPTLSARKAYKRKETYTNINKYIKARNMLLALADEMVYELHKRAVEQDKIDKKIVIVGQSDSTVPKDIRTGPMHIIKK